MTSHVLDEIERYYHAPDIIVTSRHRPSLMTTIQPALDHFDPDSQRRMFSNGQVGAKRILHVLERTSIPVEKERERERESGLRLILEESTPLENLLRYIETTLDVRIRTQRLFCI